MAARRIRARGAPISRSCCSGCRPSRRSTRSASSSTGSSSRACTAPRSATPVFVVGHARSGTTLLHRLMSRGRRALQLVPALRDVLPVAAPEEADPRARRASTRAASAARSSGACSRGRSGATARSRAIHPTGPVEPEEDDSVLYYSWRRASGSRRCPTWASSTSTTSTAGPSARSAGMMRFYADCIRRQLYLNGRDRIHLSQEPGLPGPASRRCSRRSPTRASWCPMRNPYETIPSLLKLMQLGLEGARLGPGAPAALAARSSPISRSTPIAIRSRCSRAIPEIAARGVDYRELVAEPAATIEQVYARARPPDLAGVPRGAARRGQARAPAQDGAQLQPRGVRARRGRDPQRRSRDLFERFGWDEVAHGRGTDGGLTRWLTREQGPARGVGRPDRASSSARATRSTSPSCMPAPPTDRNLAEGYRYLLGFVHGAIERAFLDDPRFPTFRTRSRACTKATIDNADAIYFCAPIDGTRVVRRARRRSADHRHWRGEAPAKTGRKAPQYLIFELSDGCLAGDSGSLAELRPGVEGADGPARLVEARGGRRTGASRSCSRPSGPAGPHRQLHRVEQARVAPAARRARASRSTAMRAGSAAASSSTTGSARTRRRSRIARVGAEGEHPPRLHARARGRAAARDGRARARPDALLERVLHRAARDLRQARRRTRRPASASCRATRSTRRTRRRARRAAARARTSTRAACSSSGPTRR